MKAYTDIEQSKKLAEILPIESADMHYNDWYYDFYDGYEHTGEYIADLGTPETICGELDIPCWSLTALLNILPKKYYPIIDHKTNLILGKPTDKWCILYWDATGMQDGEQILEDNPVDACVSMILKLHEQKIL